MSRQRREPGLVPDIQFEPINDASVLGEFSEFSTMLDRATAHGERLGRIHTGDMNAARQHSWYEDGAPDPLVLHFPMRPENFEAIDAVIPPPPIVIDDGEGNLIELTPEQERVLEMALAAEIEHQNRTLLEDDPAATPPEPLRLEPEAPPAD